jgi:hypothetical protein
MTRMGVIRMDLANDSLVCNGACRRHCELQAIAGPPG